MTDVIESYRDDSDQPEYLTTEQKVERIKQQAILAPWLAGGIGEDISQYTTPRQMMKAAGLDWKVAKCDQVIKVPKKNGDWSVIESDSKALVRLSDYHILSYVSADWNEVQNEEGFDFFFDFVKAGNMKMHSAGQFKNGEFVWILAECEEEFRLLRGKDVVKQYLLFTIPHHYGRATDVRFTAIRPICMNSLIQALKGKDDLHVKVTHREKFDPVVVGEALGLARKRMDKFHEQASLLVTKRFDDEDLMDYYRGLFPSGSIKDPKRLSRSAQQCYDSLEIQPGAELGQGTWWQAFNSVTFAMDHIVGNSPQTRLESSWNGQNLKKKVDALMKAVTFAEKSRAA